MRSTSPASNPRRSAPRSLGNRLGAYGVTAALTMFGASALTTKCKPKNQPNNPAPTAPAPAPAPAPSANEAVNLVNAERAARGLPAVSVNATLTAVAQAHSAEQAAHRTMTHTGRNGSSCGDRITAAGYSWRTWAENVAAGQPTVASVMSAWMNSAGHKANILSSSVTQIGMGSAVSADGTIYWTMVLAAPR